MVVTWDGISQPLKVSMSQHGIGRDGDDPDPTLVLSYLLLLSLHAVVVTNVFGVIVALVVQGRM